MTRVITAIGPSNRALVNHWGKDPTTNRPDSDSISITLNMTDRAGMPFRTMTSVTFSGDFERDRLFIDGKPVDLTTAESQERLRPVDALRREAGVDHPILIVSENSFPTGAGVASSASGVSTLVVASAAALGLDFDAKELSKFARKGSGSASRSLFGGLVLWERGEKADGSDSFSRQVYPPEYWPELIDVIATVSSGKKQVSSTEGMMLSRRTSPNYLARLEYIPAAIKGILQAYEHRDFDRIAPIIMSESDNLHRVMETTIPSLVYRTTGSFAVMKGVTEMNTKAGRSIAAYTIGAGPNVHIIALADTIPKVLDMLARVPDVKMTFTVGVGGSGPMVVDSAPLIDPVSMKPRVA